MTNNDNGCLIWDWVTYLCKFKPRAVQLLLLWQQTSFFINDVTLLTYLDHTRIGLCKQILQNIPNEAVAYILMIKFIIIFYLLCLYYHEEYDIN